MSPSDGAKTSSIPIAVKGGMANVTNGLPSPPLSPAGGELPPSPAMSSLSILQRSTGVQGVHGMVRALDNARNTLNKYSEVFDNLNTLSDECRRAYEDREVYMRNSLRLQADKDVLQKQIDEHSAQVKTIQGKNSEATEKLGKKVAGLEKAIKAKAASLDESAEELKKCKKDLAEIEQKLAEAKTRVEVHRKAETAAVESHKSVKMDMDKMQKTLAADKAKFEAGSAELAAIKSHYLAIKKMATNEIERLLDGISGSAYDVVYACFSRDLSEDHFDQSESNPSAAWNKFTAVIKAYTPDIPLPASNTPAAKTVRIAAVMRYLGIIATTELFQPVYLSDQGDDFGDLLSRVKDPKLADAARLVMLQVIASSKEDEEADGADDGEDGEDAEDGDDEDSVVGDGDDDAGEDEVVTPSKARANTVVKEVLELVAGLLSTAQKERFCTELLEWSRKTARIWEEKLQPLEQRIIARSPVDWVDNAGHLASLVFPSAPSTPPPSSMMRTGSFSGQRPQLVRRGSIAVGSAGATPSSVARHMHPPPPKAISTEVGVDLSDVSFSFWPVFSLADKDETVVKKSLVMTKKQVASAAEEIHHAIAPRRIQRMFERNSAARRPRQQSAAPSFLDNALAV